MVIDIPSEQLIPGIEIAIREQIKQMPLPPNTILEIENIEWNENGLKVWIKD